MLAIFLDIETTGLDPQKHQAIDIAFRIVDLTTGILVNEFQAVVKQTLKAWEVRDPLSMEINGYTWEEVSQGKDPENIKQEIISMFSQIGIERGKAVFICQNPAFDRGFFSQLIDVYTQERFNWPYHWLDLASMYWAMLVQKNNQNKLPVPERINLSKNEIAFSCQLPPEQSPHRAMNGVKHLIRCYSAVLGVNFLFEN